MTEINSLLFFIMGQHQRKYSPSLFGFFLKMEEAENLDFSRNFRLPGYVPSAIRTRGLSLRRSPDHCQSKSCSVHAGHAFSTTSFLVFFPSLSPDITIFSGEKQAIRNINQGFSSKISSSSLCSISLIIPAS